VGVGVDGNGWLPPLRLASSIMNKDLFSEFFSLKETIKIIGRINQALYGINPYKKDEILFCVECGEGYQKGEDARVDNGLKCSKCAYNLY